MTDRVLIWGAGAIGGTFGAVLASKGQDVTFVDFDAEHVRIIRESGLQITGPVEQIDIAVPAFTPDQLTGRWERIYLCVKAQHTRAAASALAPHLADSGQVVSLQNGLCEAIIAGEVGTQAVIGAFVNFGADWIRPGVIHYGNRAAFVVGEPDGTMSDRLRSVHEQVRLFEPDAMMTSDIAAYLWGKLAYGSLLMAQALGELGIADCLARRELARLWPALAGEVISVANAIGVTPVGFNGFDPVAFGPDGTRAQAEASVAAMVAFNRSSAKTHSGVWRDLAVRKRPTEVPGLVEPILRLAERYGIACPKLANLLEQVRQIERGTRANSDTNLMVLHDA